MLASMAQGTLYFGVGLKIHLPSECRASAASPDIPAIYQNTFSNQLPSECRASAAMSDIPAIYFYILSFVNVVQKQKKTLLR